MPNRGLEPDEPLVAFPGEVLTLLRDAVELLEQTGYSRAQLADELRWTTRHLTWILGEEDPRPTLGGSLGEAEKALSFVGAVRYNEVMHFTLDGEQFELKPESVRARLVDHVPEDIREYWVEIDGTRWPVKQVISLATGVTDRQRFQSQSSRRWLQKLGFPIGSGQSVTESRAPQPVRAATNEVRVAAPSVRRPIADVVLVGCVKSKAGHGALAKDLYVSDYFAKMRRYAESTGLPWFILSAEHGLLDPEEWLEPYERYLPETSRDYRRAWGEKVATQLEQTVGPLAGAVVDVHAGATYVESVEEPLGRRGVTVLDQLEGLTFGRRLSWYLQYEEAAPASGSRVISQLRDQSYARALDEVLATGGAGLRIPGIYSWWVDDAGAADLSAGLGHPIEPGLIYAGLAGATRSGGSSSSNTLWGRIATMHLGKTHEFSTLRRSIGSILATAYGQPAIDEQQLTRWMHAHLRVVPVPVMNVATLGDLETGILADLDPPLNLAKVAKTPLRQQLSILRKRYAGHAGPNQAEN